MKKRLVNYLIAATLVGTVFANTNPVSADEFDSKIEAAQQEAKQNEQAAKEMDALINQLTNDVASTEEAIHAISMEIENNEVAISIANENLEKATQELEILHNEIEVLEDNISKRAYKLEEQARIVQVNGNPTTYFEYILNSESLTEVIGRFNIVSNLIRSSNRMMEDQKRDQNAVVEKSNETEKKIVQQNTLTEELVNTSADLQAQRITQTALIAQLNLEKNTAAEDRDDLLAKRNEALQLVSDIQEEREAIRLAAEQAAREQAAREEAERKAIELAKQEEAIRVAEAARIARAEEAEAARISKANQEAQAARAAEAAREAEAARVAQAEREAEAARIAKAKEEAAVSPATSSESPDNNEASPEPTKPAAPETPAAPPAVEGWLRPANGYISSRFGYRRDPISGQAGIFHTGMDFAGSGPILAAKSGVVTAATFNSISGYYVVIDHGGGMSSLYAHMTPGLMVSPGQRVSQGQQIGTMGTTGYSTGVHLHFEIHEYGRRVDPASYLGL